MKYIVQGIVLVLLFLIVAKVLSLSIISANVNQHSLIDSSTSTNKVYTITNTPGQSLFNEKCSSCHPLFKRGLDLLKGVEDRVKDKQLLREWIRNSSKVLRSGDPYFNTQVKEYGVRMLDFPELTDQQIDDILDYIHQAELMRYH